MNEDGSDGGQVLVVGRVERVAPHHRTGGWVYLRPGGACPAVTPPSMTNSLPVQ